MINRRQFALLMFGDDSEYNKQQVNRLVKRYAAHIRTAPNEYDEQKAAQFAKAYLAGKLDKRYRKGSQ